MAEALSLSTHVGLTARIAICEKSGPTRARPPVPQELALDGRMDLRPAAWLGATLRLGVGLVRLFAAPNGGDGVLRAPLGDGLHIGAEGPCPAWRERAAAAVVTAAVVAILLLFVLTVGRGLGEDERL